MERIRPSYLLEDRRARIIAEEEAAVALVADLEQDSNLLSVTFELADRAYKALVDKEYVEDPIFVPIGATAMAIVGMIPYSFTMRTRKGHREFRKIEALFWTYERSGNTTHVAFRIWKIVDAFKQVFTEEAEEESRNQVRTCRGLKEA
jgi:hypothetical protein